MNKNKDNKMFNESWINFINYHYIQNMYKNFLKDKNSVNKFWKNKFILLKNSSYQKKNINNQYLDTQLNQEIKKKYLNKKKILKILNFFRLNGFRYANINPLKKNIKKKIFDLDKKIFKFKEKYLKKKIKWRIDNKKKKFLNLNFFLKWLKKKYCHTIGFEFSHIYKKKEKEWIQKYIENQWTKKKISDEKKIEILNAIISAQTFEKYINSKYPSYKRFSLEGNDSLIPMLYEIISQSLQKKFCYFYIGMAHRGRLNVLINVLGKPSNLLFQEFSDKDMRNLNTGDVKYHFGFYSDIYIKNFKKGDINLEYNPSHLEIINPVIMGISRYKYDSLQSKNFHHIIPIMIHGDAAFTGQGIIQEILNMSQTPGYGIGGSIHIIINNQIGFTTSNIKHIRSSKYSTDLAKSINALILHVNADDPEAAFFAAKMSVDYRNKFQKDIFIDLIGYRRNGHNEVDDPFVTQPLMYKKIKSHPTVQDIYSKKLIDQKLINKRTIQKKIILYQDRLNQGKKILPNYSYLNFKKKNIDNHLKIKKFIKISQKFTEKKIKKIFKKINFLPKKINLHPLVKKIYSNRLDVINKNQKFDWGTAENFAYACLLNQGISCRISGEDISRGTFFHRHAIIYDQITGEKYIPLKKSIKNSKLFLIDSVLSEESVLAFEYGYSLRNSNTLTIWEAQFGDFANVSQVVIDQFISSSMEKWNQSSRVILLLPHGYEGQGPEHSSARIERYLQLCANKNMNVCIPTTASQIFHLLYQHIFHQKSFPLIIFSPKSLLRNPMSQSSFSEIYEGKFQKIICEIDFSIKQDFKKIIFCTGKIYYELLEARRKKNIYQIMLIRIEQLYPFPKKKILKIINKYSMIKNIFWCQEEPKNQGAWNYIKNTFEKLTYNKINIQYIGRKNSSSPATGNFYIHKKEQEKIIHSALNI
ncbi:2-oxoglutarate dehydrogenase E1 component [Buchnera aphidicola]|uniref:2-oxoglutarate dehydrogenase E1 component n=1 Tax=Buchnera aphidicola TaxID=9 RepID=UPI002093BB43|nr:2-oxoglutarate dehydrogenase E1 component [Buchnera aphidicola]USS94327.1 2-oxoglutarate dehydrogenase E1 component [Buchnera aphidicola (Sipha maydis)]